MSDFKFPFYFRIIATPQDVEVAIIGKWLQHTWVGDEYIGYTSQDWVIDMIRKDEKGFREVFDLDPDKHYEIVGEGVVTLHDKKEDSVDYYHTFQKAEIP